MRVVAGIFECPTESFPSVARVDQSRGSLPSTDACLHFDGQEAELGASVLWLGGDLLQRLSRGHEQKPEGHPSCIAIGLSAARI
jgi:hypothetical protein